MSRFTLLPILLALLVAGCTNPGARIQERPVVGAVAENLEKADGLDRRSAMLLRREGLLWDFRRDPVAALRELDRRWSGNLNEERQADLAALWSAAAGREKDGRASGFLLTAAEYAWPLAIAEQNSDIRRRGRAIHTHCCGELSERLFETTRAGQKRVEIAGPLRNYRLDITTPGIRPAQRGRFDTLIRANRLKLRKMDMPRHRVEGLGADLVFHRINTPERYDVDPLVHQGGLAIPVNASLVFDRSPGKVELRMNDMTLVRTTRVNGRSLPLSADFTAPYAVMLNHSEFNNAFFGLEALFKTTEYDDATGIYQVEPWRKDQIPVVFVHGLASSPLTWLNIFNEFSADPVLQKRYQFLAFRYPTGYPITRNAASLRRHLREMRKLVDPSGTNPNMDRMIMVGHSMGGLLSNLQLRSSGEEFRKLAFARPLEEIEMTDEQRRQVREIAYFEPDPNVRRAVFIASPHRGSPIAGNRLGRFGSRLIRLPVEVLTYGLTGQQIQGTTAFGSRLLTEGNDSIKTLEADNPILTTTLELPLGRGVQDHSIIGNHRMTEPLTESSDGLVKYWSSHLEDAASEKIVEATHTSILRNDAAIEELRRLLYQHAGLKYDR